MDGVITHSARDTDLLRMFTWISPIVALTQELIISLGSDKR